MINEVRRWGRYTAADFERVASDAASTMRRLRHLLDEADSFVRRIPTDKIGVLFLKDGQPVQPDPGHLDEYVTREGTRYGHWPSSSEISSAMLEPYSKLPSP